MNEYLGRPVSYWVELHLRADELDLVRPLIEIAELRAKVSFYESRIDEINNFKKSVEVKNERL